MLPRVTKANMITLFPPESDYQSNYDGRDYCQLENFGNVSIGSCKIRGYRTTFEDELAHSVDVAQQFKYLNNEAQHRVLEKTFKSLQADFGQIPEVGSTACVTTAWMKNNLIYACNANVGDSNAFLIAVNVKNKISGRFPLSHPHNPNHNEQEKKRVMQITPLAKQNQQLYLLNNNSLNRKLLAVTRSIGDNDMEASGLLHAPEIFHFMEAAPENARVFLITASDGLFEPENMAELCEQIVYDCVAKKLSLHSIAAQLTYAAFHKKSGDNISVAITELSDVPVSLAVFDGHCGDIVAKNLAASFYPRLKQMINNLYPKHNINVEIHQCLLRENWPAAVNLLTRLLPAQYHNLDFKLLRLLQQYRPQLTEAFIENTNRMETSEIIDAVKGVLDQTNGLGVMLNLLRPNRLGFAYSMQYIDGIKTSGSIKKIHTAFEDYLHPVLTELSPRRKTT
jgi:serine/threonine protein phosphatase PrpC